MDYGKAAYDRAGELAAALLPPVLFSTAVCEAFGAGPVYTAFAVQGRGGGAMTAVVKFGGPCRAQLVCGSLKGQLRSVTGEAVLTLCGVFKGAEVVISADAPPLYAEAVLLGRGVRLKKKE